MDKAKLRATVAELEQELRDSANLDDESRQMLRQTVGEIRAALRDEETPLESQSLAQRLSEATGKFEGSHPALTNVVARLIDGLAQMGI
jgi:Domain of unknown function (DUF4404)